MVELQFGGDILVFSPEYSHNYQTVEDCRILLLINKKEFGVQTQSHVEDCTAPYYLENVKTYSTCRRDKDSLVYSVHSVFSTQTPRQRVLSLLLPAGVGTSFNMTVTGKHAI